MQLDKSTGRPLRVWPCAADAWRTLGLGGDQRSGGNSIRAVCRGVKASCRGFGWRYAAAPRDDGARARACVRSGNNKKPVLVVQLDLAGTTVTP